MNDVELTEALNKLYAKEDISSPERVEEKKAVSEYEPKLRRERYEIGMHVDVIVDYKDRYIDVVNASGSGRFPFDTIPSLIQFLGWLIDFRKIGKE